MINVNKPGLMTSIQDLGRYGFQKDGVIVSGVMDPLSHRLANLLVGNEENEATLEITLLGPVLHFKEDALIALCGGNLTPLINGKPVRMWRAIYIKSGSELRFGNCKSGCRTYLAAAGGLDISKVMGSRSTYLRAGIGGFNGRALEKDDEIGIKPQRECSLKVTARLKKKAGEAAFCEEQWSPGPELKVDVDDRRPIRVLKGRQYRLFKKNSQEQFFGDSFEILPQSDRMGYRLKGPVLSLENEEEMLSEAVSFGTVQVPSEGNPIVLLADRQTTGGYPKIGQIATVDLPRMAQYKPGEKITFEEISHREAEKLLLDEQESIQNLKRGIQLKWR